MKKAILLTAAFLFPIGYGYVMAHGETVVSEATNSATIVVTNNAIHRIDDAGSERIAVIGPNDIVVVNRDGGGITPPGDDDDDDDDDDDGGTSLEDRVFRAAMAVGDAGASMTIGDGYQFSAVRLTEGEDVTWESQIAATRTFRALAASLSTKTIQWNAMFVELDKQIALSPKTAQTFLDIAKGFERAAAAGALQGDDGASQIQWQKLLLCLPCIFDAFLSAEEELNAEVDPQQPTLAPPPDKVSVLVGKTSSWSTRTPAEMDRWIREFDARVFSK